MLSSKADSKAGSKGNKEKAEKKSFNPEAVETSLSGLRLREKTKKVEELEQILDSWIGEMEGNHGLKGNLDRLKTDLSPEKLKRLQKSIDEASVKITKAVESIKAVQKDMTSFADDIPETLPDTTGVVALMRAAIDKSNEVSEAILGVLVRKGSVSPSPKIP